MNDLPDPVDPNSNCFNLASDLKRNMFQKYLFYRHKKTNISGILHHLLDFQVSLFDWFIVLLSMTSKTSSADHRGLKN